MSKKTIIVDAELQQLVAEHYGDVVLLVTTTDWLLTMRLVMETSSVSNSEFILADILGIAIVTGCVEETVLQELAAVLHLSIKSFSNAKDYEVDRWLLELALDNSDNECKEAAYARKTAAILRQNYEEQQHRFEALENLVYDSGISALSLALAMPVTWDRLALAAHEISGTNQSLTVDAYGSIAQQLPISARRIIAVELHFRSFDLLPRNGQIEVAICDLSGEALTPVVAIELGLLKPGWNRFNFPVGVDCTDRDAVLRIVVVGGGGVECSLAPACPIRRFWPRNQKASEVGEKPIAVKVWRGSPNVRARRTIQTASFGKTCIYRSSGDLPRARIFNSSEQDTSFNPVQYWAKEDGFLIHPPPRGMTLGIIENVDFERLLCVSAVVNSAHIDGPIISFAIGVVPSGKIFSAPDILGSWLTLPPLGWGEVQVPLSAPISGQVDIILASMVASGNGNRLAWALFRGFSFNLD